jgi:DNA-binding CsgD family transcriptional regulator
MAALATLSRLLLALHQAADDLEADALPPAALARLQQDLPFDAAVWASGAATAEGPRFHGLHLMQLPMQMLADYEPLKQHDTLFARCVARPGRAVCAAACEAPPPLQAHLLRYGLAQAVSIVVLAPTAGLISGLSLYRRQADRPFDADDVALLEAVYPHLDQAEQRCQLARLQAAARGEPRHAAGAAACDAQGLVRQADPRFLAQLQAEWPGWHGPWLPPPLAALAAAPGAVADVPVGRASTARCQALGPLRLLHLRPRRPADSLPQRLRQVAALAVQGHSHKAIAAQLGLAPATVRNQLADLYGRLGVRSRAALAASLLGDDGGPTPPAPTPPPP